LQKHPLPSRERAGWGGFVWRGLSRVERLRPRRARSNSPGRPSV